MAYTPHVMKKRAYQRFKQVFRSKLYEGKVGLFEMLRHWWTVRQVVRGLAYIEIEKRV